MLSREGFRSPLRQAETAPGDASIAAASSACVMPRAFIARFRRAGKFSLATSVNIFRAHHPRFSVTSHSVNNISIAPSAPMSSCRVMLGSS